MQGKPTMMVIAGPEGAGKTTLYEQDILPKSRLLPEPRPYVSADKVQDQMLGDKTNRAYGAGNLIAEQQARQLIGERKSLVVETTFAKESDLRLVKDAKDAGYTVVIQQLGTRSPELSIARVAERVKEGGRDAPEAAIRQDYARGPELIREASKIADRTYVRDASALNREPAHVLTLERGRVTFQAKELPEYVAKQYAGEIQLAREGQISAAERSLAKVIAKAEERAPGANVQIVGREKGEFKGPIVETTTHHTLQQTGEKSFVAHLSQKLAVVPVTDRVYDKDIKITYSDNPRDKATLTYAAAEPKRTPEQNKQDARDYLTKPREEASKNPRIAAAYAVEDRLSSALAAASPRTDAVEHAMEDNIRKSIAGKLAEGKPVEVNKAIVDTINRQTAEKSITAALREKEQTPGKEVRIEPEHRSLLVNRADGLVKAANEGRFATAQDKERANNEAKDIATKLGRVEGTRLDSSFQSKELQVAYKDAARESVERQQTMQQQKTVARGMDR